MRNKKLILLLLLIFMSVLGISYAGWNNVIHLNATASTGNIKLAIQPAIEMDGFTKFDLIEQTEDTIKFKAEIEKSNMGLLKLSIINIGSLPVKLEETILEPEESTTKNISIPEGFEKLSLKYTTQNGSWERELYIEGDIMVKEVPINLPIQLELEDDLVFEYSEEFPQIVINENEDAVISGELPIPKEQIEELNVAPSGGSSGEGVSEEVNQEVGERAGEEVGEDVVNKTIPDDLPKSEENETVKSDIDNLTEVEGNTNKEDNEEPDKTQETEGLQE